MQQSFSKMSAIVDVLIIVSYKILSIHGMLVHVTESNWVIT